MSPKPTDRHAHTLSPVNGSVRPDPAVAVDCPELEEPVPVELLLGEPLDPLDDGDEPEDDEELPGDEELPEDEDELDPWEEDEEPDP